MAQKHGTAAARRKQWITAVIIIIIIAVLTAWLAADYINTGKIPIWDRIFAQDEPPRQQTVPSYIDAINSLVIYFFDVGQGDSILLRFPGGIDFLIDAGSGTSASKTAIEAYLQALEAVGLDDIEYMMATHPDSDHINMLDDVLQKYDVHNIFYNGGTYTSAAFKRFAELAENETYGDNTAASITYFDGDGDIYTVIEQDGISVTVYAPGYQRFAGSNAMSPITVVEYGGKRAVLTGDAEVATEQWFIGAVGQDSLDCDILKVGHHGSRTSSCAEFLDYITCEYAVISNGATYGHPHQETLEKLSERSYTVYQTHINGTITCYIDIDGDIAFVTQK